MFVISVNRGYNYPRSKEQADVQRDSPGLVVLFILTRPDSDLLASRNDNSNRVLRLGLEVCANYFLQAPNPALAP